ncbi:MAG: molecular chaperone TorD family protein [Alcanivoracaceae bacterium]
MANNAPLWHELWSTLAQAWQPPTTALQCLALRECLADDLRSLGHELSLEVDTRMLSQTLVGSDDQTLLVIYSRLFLVPPHAAYIALGSGVDGDLMGPYAQTMSRFLQELGLQLSSESHERPDDLPVLLEVMARLETEPAAGQWQRVYLSQVLQGLAPLQRSLMQHAAETPWRYLADLTYLLVAHRLALLGANEPAQMAPDMALQRQQQREALNLRVQQDHRYEAVPEAAVNQARQAGIPAQAMLEMIASLEAQGLDASHLRGQLPADGWARLTPPPASRKK